DVVARHRWLQLIPLLQQLAQAANPTGQQRFPFLLETDFARTAMKESDSLVGAEFSVDLEERFSRFHAARVVARHGHFAAGVPAERRGGQHSLAPGDHFPSMRLEHIAELPEEP